MILLNFSHPLTSAQLATIEQLTEQSIERVLDIKTQFDHNQPFAEQARAVVDGIGLSPEQWQTLSLLVNLPSLSAIAALVLAEVHGRCGYFPAAIRLKPVPQTTPPQFEVAEIINLQAVREVARGQR
jgi:hypothetical protein